MLQVLNHLWSPSGLSQQLCISAVPGKPRAHHSTPGVILPVLNRGEISLSEPAGKTPSNVAQDTVQLPYHKGTVMVLVQLAAHQDFRAFPTKLFWPIDLQHIPVHLAVPPLKHRLDMIQRIKVGIY